MPSLYSIIHTAPASNKEDDLIVRSTLEYLATMSDHPRLRGAAFSRSDYFEAAEDLANTHFLDRETAFINAFNRVWPKFTKAGSVKNQVKHSPLFRRVINAITGKPNTEV